MQFGVLVTNHGKHSNEKLAIATAGDIIQIGADANGEQAIEGRKLENKIAEILEKHFGAVATNEHAGIAENGAAHLASSLDAHDGIHSDAVAGVMAAVKDSPVAKWFDVGDVEQNVRNAVAKWIKAAQHMHRDWYARHGKIGDGTDLKVPDGHDHLAHTLDANVKRWKDMHDGGADEYRQAVHEHAVALKAAEPAA